jgi:hypothetical protein
MKIPVFLQRKRENGLSSEILDGFFVLTERRPIHIDLMSENHDFVEILPSVTEIGTLGFAD